MNLIKGLGTKDLWHAVEQLRQHKLRTALTLLGMVFGVGAVIAMLSIGEGAKQEALRMIESMGLRNILVEARDFDEDTLREIRAHSIGLSLGDVCQSVLAVSSVEGVSAEKKIKTWSLFSQQAPSDAQVLAVSPEYFELASLKAVAGRQIETNDSKYYAQVAVLGAQAARSLFPDGAPLGQRVKINHLWVKVVGVLEDKDLGKDEFQGVSLGGDRNRVFIPLETAHKRLKFELMESELDGIRLKLDRNADPQLSALTVNHLLSLAMAKKTTTRS